MIADPTHTAFSGSIWYQEPYFLRALQEEIDEARQDGSQLSLVVLRMEDYSRRAARHLFLYAGTEPRNVFFGILANGDYAICLPGSGYADAMRERAALAHDLHDFGVCSGLAVLDRQTTAADLLHLAAHNCACTHTHFEEERAA